MKNIKTIGNLAIKEEPTIGMRLACDAIVTNAFPLGENDGKFARIPCALLMIDDGPDGYQRGEKGKVIKIAREWNEKKCDNLKVSYRDGSFWVFDGKQRLTAARLIGLYDIKCTIYEGMTREDEARELARQNKNKTPMSTYATLMAEAVAGTDPYAAIVAICKDLGVPLVESRRPGAGECGCAGRLVSCYKRNGHDGLIWVLETIEELEWGYVKNGYSSTVIAALSSICAKQIRFGIDKTAENLKAIVGKQTPNGAIAQAMSEYPGHRSVSALTQYLSGVVKKIHLL